VNGGRLVPVPELGSDPMAVVEFVHKKFAEAKLLLNGI
jgi:hypothetical protein